MRNPAACCGTLHQVTAWILKESLGRIFPGTLLAEKLGLEVLPTTKWWSKTAKLSGPNDVVFGTLLHLHFFRQDIVRVWKPG